MYYINIKNCRTKVIVYVGERGFGRRKVLKFFFTYNLCMKEMSHGSLKFTSISRRLHRVGQLAEKCLKGGLIS